MDKDTVIKKIDELIERAKVARDEYLKLNQEQVDVINRYLNVMETHLSNGSGSICGTGNKEENYGKETYKKIIFNGDHVELIRMIKSLHFQREKREAEGKHLYLADERLLKEAERILFEEFQYVLNLSKEDIIKIIMS